MRFVFCEDFIEAKQTRDSDTMIAELSKQMARIVNFTNSATCSAVSEFATQAVDFA
jgi:hypothetical protein